MKYVFLQGDVLTFFLCHGFEIGMETEEVKEFSHIPILKNNGVEVETSVNLTQTHVPIG